MIIPLIMTFDHCPAEHWFFKTTESAPYGMPDTSYNQLTGEVTGMLDTSKLHWTKFFMDGYLEQLETKSPQELFLYYLWESAYKNKLFTCHGSMEYPGKQILRFIVSPERYKFVVFPMHVVKSSSTSLAWEFASSGIKLPVPTDNNSLLEKPWGAKPGLGFGNIGAAKKLELWTDVKLEGLKGISTIDNPDKKGFEKLGASIADYIKEKIDQPSMMQQVLSAMEVTEENAEITNQKFVESYNENGAMTWVNTAANEIQEMEDKAFLSHVDKVIEKKASGSPNSTRT